MGPGRNTTKDTAALASPWVNLGFTSSDGVKFNKKDKNDPVDTWQSMAPARFMLSDRDLTLKFQLLQMNKDTFPFYLGLSSASVVSAAPRRRPPRRRSTSPVRRAVRTSGPSPSTSRTTTAPRTCGTGW